MLLVSGISFYYITERFSLNESLSAFFYFQGNDKLNYQEYKQSLNQKLFDKIQKELSAFRKEMLSKSPQEILMQRIKLPSKMILPSVFLTQIILRQL